MTSKLSLYVLTPERLFFGAEVEQAIVTSTDGEYGLLADHAPMVAALKSGEMRIFFNERWLTAFVSDGVLSVHDNQATVLCQSAEWPDEISERRIEESRHRAQERIRQAHSKREYITSQATLARAMVRLRIKQSSSLGPHT